MKSFLSRIAIALVITSLAGVVVFAKTKQKTVTLESAMKLNGTLIEKGVYALKFDDKSGELSIMKDNKVIAHAIASAEKRDKKARQFVLRSAGEGSELQLTGVTFAGAEHDIIVNGSQASR